MKKNIKLLFLLSALLAIPQSMQSMETFKEKVLQARAGLAIGYYTGLRLVPGSFMLPLAIAFAYDDPKADPRVIIPSAVVGHVLGYGTWAAAAAVTAYGAVKFAHYYKPYTKFHEMLKNNF